MELNYIPFKAAGESQMNQIFGLFSIGSVFFFTIWLSIFSEKAIGHLVGVILTFLIIFWFRKMIRTVEFGLDKITVTYLYGNKKSIAYRQLKKFYKNDEGTGLTFVYVILFEEKRKRKKITFWKNDIDKEVLKIELLYLKEKDRWDK